MEKIKEALQKAKSTSSATQKNSKVPSVELKQTDSNPVPSDLDKILYTNTRVIQADQSHLEKNRIFSMSRHNVASSAIDSLRTQVLQKMYENGWRSIGIVSPTPACGKTFLAINLAISIANQPNKTAMLVDFDLRRPRVAKYLGIDNGMSLNDFFLSEAEVGEVMVNIIAPRLVVLPTMNPIDNSSELLSSARAETLINDIYNRYDSRVVIYDLPPILNADDSLVMMRKVDCVLIVVGSGLVKQNELEETMHHIPKDKLLGVVLNKAESQTEDYYY